MKKGLKKLVGIAACTGAFLIGTQAAYAYNLMAGYVKFAVNSYSLTYSYTKSGSYDYSTHISKGVSAWNSSPATVYISKTSSNGNIGITSTDYGNTGWHGKATIPTQISNYTKGAVKLNDYYYSSGNFTTNGPELVAHELGHVLGIAHISTSTSLMIPKGYKGSPTPSSDDVNGVNYWY